MDNTFGGRRSSMLGTLFLALTLIVSLLAAAPAAALTGSIAGVVAEDGTGSPLASAVVTFYDAGGVEITSTSTAPDGSYTAAGLTTGTYRIKVTAAGHVSEWYLNAVDFASGTDVVVTDTATTTANVSMAVAGSITGIVTEDGGSVPVTDATVTIYDLTNTFVDSAATAGDGTYSVAGLAVGTYRVEVTSPTHVTEWFLNSVDFASATDVGVTAGSASTVDMAVAVAPGSITGTVTEDGGSVAVTDATATIYDLTNTFVDSAATAGDGTYSVVGLAVGTYRVEVTSPTHITEWYMDAVDFASATDVGVTAGSASTVDMSVAVPGSITGLVTEDGGSIPVTDATVTIYDLSNVFVDSAVTAGDGTYSVIGLAVGTYRVGVTSPTHVTEWFLNAVDFASATDVGVTAGSASTVDMLIAVAPGSITGLVTEDGGSVPVTDATVTIYNLTNTFVDSAATAGDGTYSVTGLPVGTYRVEVTSPTFENEWYLDAADFATATDVTVAAGSAATVDMSLALSDVSPPSVVVSLPVDGATVAPPVSVSGTASDDVGVASVLLEIFDRDTSMWWNGSAFQVSRTSVAASLGAGTTLRTWSYSFAPGSPASLPYWVTVRSFDAAPNASAYSYIDFTIAVGAIPTVSISTPADGATVGAPLMMDGFAYDDVGVTSVALEIFDRDTSMWWNGSSWQVARTSVGAALSGGSTSRTWSYSFAPGPPATLPYWLTARAFDASANSSTYVTADFTLTGADVPTVVIATPSDGATVSAPVSMSGSATDDVGVTSVALEIFDRDTSMWWNGAAWQVSRTSFLATLGAGSTSRTWSFTFSPVSPAALPYWLTARSFDGSANISPYATADFTISGP